MIKVRYKPTWKVKAYHFTGKSKDLPKYAEMYSPYVEGSTCKQCGKPMDIHGSTEINGDHTVNVCPGMWIIVNEWDCHEVLTEYEFAERFDMEGV